MASEFKINGKELLAKIEELIKEGNARRIIIKDEKGRTYIEIPVTLCCASADTGSSSCNCCSSFKLHS
jgi:hypothetical protein